MDKICPSCGRDPGDGYRCRHCGEMQYRYAIESDDWKGRHPELEDEQGWGAPPEPADVTEEPPPLEAIVEELRRGGPDPAPEPDEPDEPFFANEPVRAPEPIAPTTSPQATNRGCRGCLVVVVVIGILLVGIGIVFSLVVGESFDSAFTEVTADAGECLLLEADGVSVVETTTVPCDEPHDAEVYVTSTFPDGAFPGDSALASEADDVCWDAFEAYVGTPYADSIYFYDWLVPSEDGWAAGDRELLCTIVSGDGSRLVGSAFASGR